MHPTASERLDRRTILRAAALTATVLAPGVAVAAGSDEAVTRAGPGGASPGAGPGFAAAGLARLGEVMTRHVHNGRLPGLVALVSRRGETHVEAVGTFGFDDATPMRRDTIFRVASVTKPIVAAAAMMLVEEGRLRLDDPVDALLPELADRRVLTSLEAPLDDTVPANRPITLRDLLTFRAGYGAIMVFPEKHPIQFALAEAGVASGPQLLSLPDDALMAAFGRLPLAHQPGEQWLYNSGSDILGVLIARASGGSLGAFLAERIFEPLGMSDTAFHVPPQKTGRLPALFATDFATGAVTVFDPAGTGSRFATPPTFESGAGGLVSTADDLHAFAAMMIGEGAHRGRRLLSRPSIALMTTDQITPEQKSRSPFAPGFWDDRGWGFGVSIVTHRGELAGTPGRYGWDGGYGTSWYVDPAEGLIGIFLSQRVWDAPVEPAELRDFWTTAYAAIPD